MKNKLPDLLAWFRLLSSPVLLFLILDDGSDTGLMLYPAILAFIAAWSDYFDGYLARKWDVSSKLGAFLDTIADKIFVTFVFAGFSIIGRVSIWITVLLIAREFMIMGLRGLAGNDGIMIPPSRFGKAKASLQFWAIGFVMIDLSFTIFSLTIAELFVLHALIFSYISAYQYVISYFQSKNEI